jgi:hypothetical protein
VLEQPAFQDAALYTADALGKVMLEVGATVSTTTDTDAVPVAGFHSWLALPLPGAVQ